MSKDIERVETTSTELVVVEPRGEDITPDDSVAPVYLDPTPGEPVEAPVFEDDAAVKAAAVAKLTALGLTPDEARIVTGG